MDAGGVWHGHYEETGVNQWNVSGLAAETDPPSFWGIRVCVWYLYLYSFMSKSGILDKCILNGTLTIVISCEEICDTYSDKIGMFACRQLCESFPRVIWK